MNAKEVVKSLLDNLPATLPGYVGKQRWFQSKARIITKIKFNDIASFSKGPPLYFMALLCVEYTDRNSEVYYIPLAVATPEKGGGADPSKLISSILIGKDTTGVYEASEDEAFNREILDAIGESKTTRSRKGSFVFEHTDLLPDNCSATIKAGSIKKIAAEQTNTSIIFGDAFIMKNYRKIEEGTNPDFDITHFLTARTDFRNFPALLGYIEYQQEKGEKATMALLQNYIGDADDCWEWTCGHLRGLYASLGSIPEQDIPVKIRSFSRDYLAQIKELGRITARFHIALASDHNVPSFDPEPITAEDIAKWDERFSSQIRSVLRLVAEKLPSFPKSIKRDLSSITEHELAFLERIKGLTRLSDEGVRKIRVHGDYHLGQVLLKGDTFFIIDFEGEPARPLPERKEKQCALKDIAGMLRSFDYAAYALLFELTEPEMRRLEEWGMAWRDLARSSFLDGYLEETGMSEASFLPSSRETLYEILSIYELDKAIYELNYELNNRPDWLRIPIRGLLGILGQ